MPTRGQWDKNTCIPNKKMGSKGKKNHDLKNIITQDSATKDFSVHDIGRTELFSI